MTELFRRDNVVHEGQTPCVETRILKASAQLLNFLGSILGHDGRETS